MLAHFVAIVVISVLVVWPLCTLVVWAAAQIFTHYWCEKSVSQDVVTCNLDWSPKKVAGFITAVAGIILMIIPLG